LVQFIQLILPYLTLQIKLEYSTTLAPKATFLRDPEQLGYVIITSFLNLMLYRSIILDLSSTAFNEYSLSYSSGDMPFL